MSLILIPVISILGILLGKFLFKKLLNHLTLYCFLFVSCFVLYELKLLPYVNIIPFAWFIIIVSFLSFFGGTLTIISARNLFKENPTFIEQSDISIKIISDCGKPFKFDLF